MPSTPESDHALIFDDMIIELLEFEFMQHALLAGVLISMICGIMGTLVVVNRIVFLSGGIAHAAYGGIGLAFYFKLPILWSTLGFALLTATLMAGISLRHKHRSDTIIGVLWAAGMAVGILLIDLSPGYHVDLMSYLFGSILTVSRSDLGLMLGLSILITGLTFFFYADFLAMSYDEAFARIRGVPVTQLYFLLISMVALVVVLSIRVVGLILVVALLTIPPYIAEMYVRTLGKMMLLASILGAGFTTAGLWLSYQFNLTAGAAIIAIATAAFLFSYLLKGAMGYFQKNTAS